MSLEIVLPDGYIFIVGLAIAMGFQCCLIGFGVMAVRSRVFNKAFFEKHYPEEKEFARIHREGYPDMGGGQFSSKLSHSDWADFNYAQRAHHNYLEGLTLIVLVLLVSGLTLPQFSFYLGVIYIIGRQLYAIGYKQSGPGGRRFGVILVDVAMIVLTVTAFYSVFSLGGGITPFLKFISPKFV